MQIVQASISIILYPIEIAIRSYSSNKSSYFITMATDICRKSSDLSNMKRQSRLQKVITHLSLCFQQMPRPDGCQPHQKLELEMHIEVYFNYLLLIH